MPVRGVLMLAFFVASLPVCLFRPFYGILLFSVVSYLNPQASLMYWSGAAAFPWALAVAIPTICGLLFSCSPFPQRLASREVALIVILWVWFTITTVISTHTPVFFHHSQDTLDRWQFVSKILLMTLVTIGIVDSFARLRVWVMVMSGCFGLIVVRSLPGIIMTGGGARIYGPDLSMVADNNDLGLALDMTLPLFFFLAQSEPTRAMRRLFGALFAVTIPAIFCTYSRGALIGLTVILVLMFVQLKRKFVLVPIFVLAAGGALLFAPEAWKERMNPSQGLDSSARERLNAWTFSWDLVKDYPVFGGGFSTFTPELFAKYAPVAEDVKGPHSVYFGVLAEHGFPGLALYLTLAASCLVKLLRLVKYARIYGDETVAAYVHMFEFSIIAFLVSGCFLGRAYFDYFFAMVACVVILDQLARKSWASTDEDATGDEGQSDAVEETPLVCDGMAGMEKA